MDYIVKTTFHHTSTLGNDGEERKREVRRKLIVNSYHSSRLKCMIRVASELKTDVN